MFYREANPVAGRTIVVVHGLTGTSASMLFMAAAFAKRGDRVVVLDLPGHGHSSTIPVVNMDDLAVWLHEVLHGVLRLQEFVLVGNSFGSSVCLAYAHKYGLPANSRMVLSAPIPSISPLLALPDRALSYVPGAIMKKLYYANRLAEPFRIWYLLANPRDKTLYGKVSDCIRTEGPLVQHRYAGRVLMPANIRSNVFSRALPDDIARRTAIVFGAKDQLAGKRARDTLRNWHPDVDVVEVDHSGHLVHIEAIDTMRGIVSYNATMELK